MTKSAETSFSKKYELPQFTLKVHKLFQNSDE